MTTPPLGPLTGATSHSSEIFPWSEPLSCSFPLSGGRQSED